MPTVLFYSSFFSLMKVKFSAQVVHFMLMFPMFLFLLFPTVRLSFIKATKETMYTAPGPVFKEPYKSVSLKKFFNSRTWCM